MVNEYKFDISIIIPAFNESESLNELYIKLFENIQQLKLNAEYLFIDDGSTDGTNNVVREIIDNHPNQEILLISHQQNFGKTQAIKSGIHNSNGRYVLMLDADLQDDPDYLPKFCSKIQDQKVDLIIGHRVKRYKNNYLKRLSSFVINRLVTLISGYSIHDMNCGYKLMTIDCAKNLDLKSDYHRYIPFLALISGYKVSEVEIEQKKRIHGVSKYGKTGVKRLIKSLMDIISITFIYKFRDNPFDLFGRIGLYLTLLGGIILAYLGFRWLQGIYIEGRPLFFVGILFVIVGINNISLGLLGELIDINTNRKIKRISSKYIIYKNKYSNSKDD